MSDLNATVTTSGARLDAAINQRVRAMRGGQGSTFLGLLALAAGRRDVIALGRGEPDVPTPPHIAKAAIDAINAGRTTYTHPAGVIALREAIARKLQRDNGLTYDPETGHAVGLRETIDDDGALPHSLHRRDADRFEAFVDNLIVQFV